MQLFYKPLHLIGEKENKTLRKKLRRVTRAKNQHTGFFIVRKSLRAVCELGFVSCVIRTAINEVGLKSLEKRNADALLKYTVLLLDTRPRNRGPSPAMLEIVSIEGERGYFTRF